MNKSCLAGLTSSAFGLLALAIRPDLDRAAAALFFQPPDHFIGDTAFGTVVRYVAWIVPFALLALLVVASFAARCGLWPRKFAPRSRSLLFLLLSFALSPGLLVYGTLKPLAHRPRPQSIVEFGGTASFRPFTRFDGACTASCSFPSGETAGSFWLVAPASLAPMPWRGPALAGAFVFGAATGLLRMAFGGHFLSDVLAAAFLTLLSVLFARQVSRFSKNPIRREA